VNDLQQPVQGGYPWMQLPQVQFPQSGGQSGYGDLAGALVGRGLQAVNKPKPQKMFDSPMQNQNPMSMVHALAGLPVNV